MRPRRAATDLAGVLAIDKPSGLTSHDVVAVVRGATGEGRIGHAGTLDPLASGLLLVLVGRATRLARYLVGHDKRYDARITFGTTTDTLDADGTITESVPVPPGVLDPAYARRLLESLVGSHLQIPPAYSAIKTAGVAAHRRARAGDAPVLEPRPIVISEARLVAVDPDAPSWDVTFAVSKGTYVRALARDVGRLAGTVAHLAALRRTSVGALDLGSALTLDAALDSAREGTLPSCFIDPVPLLNLPVVHLVADEPRDGSPVSTHAGEQSDGDRVALLTPGGLLGIYVASRGVLRAETAFVPEIPR